MQHDIFRSDTHQFKHLSASIHVQLDIIDIFNIILANSFGQQKKTTKTSDGVI